MANIGFIQHRLSRTDGVSLEVDKWRSVLEAAGVFIAENATITGEPRPIHPPAGLHFPPA